MKFHWGTGIFLFLGLFITALIAVFIKSLGHDNSLVMEDYYYYDIHYQQIMDKKRNYSTLKKPIVIHENDSLQRIEIYFPDEESGAWTGKVQLYRPSAKNFDRSFDVDCNNKGVMYIDSKDLPAGLWKIKLDVTRNHTDYYMENTLSIH